MAAVETSSAQLGGGFVDAYELARRSMFEAAARVLRYHATARDLKLAPTSAALADRTATASAQLDPSAAS